MFYIYLFLMISPCVATTFSTPTSKLRLFDLFGAINNAVGGLFNFGTLIEQMKDIFSIVLSDYQPIRKNSSIPVPEDALLNISQLATKYGYVLEEHRVVTDDGYILKLHRIPCGVNGSKNNLTVFLMHGLIDSSDSWVLQGPDKALGYMLADQGFDVWMGNARGNKHALSHVKLKPTEPAFWKFTWEEIGIYDLPAMIDYALNLTAKESLYYVGHSQGTTSFYVMNSIKPEYNTKIKMMVSLAPVAWMSHAKSPAVKMFSPVYRVLAYLLSNFNTYSPTTDYFNKISTVVCSIIPKRCDNVLYMIVGNDYRHLNESMLPVVLGHMPTGSSMLQFVHYGQLVQSERFCRYDFGEERNLVMYGQPSPPDYKLNSITVPMAIYYSGNDWLSDLSDVEMLKTQINVFDENYIEDFSHLDFMYASMAKNIIYLKIISQIYDFENGYTNLGG